MKNWPYCGSLDAFSSGFATIGSRGREKQSTTCAENLRLLESAIDDKNWVENLIIAKCRRARLRRLASMNTNVIIGVIVAVVVVVAIAAACVVMSQRNKNKKDDATITQTAPSTQNTQTEQASQNTQSANVQKAASQVKSPDTPQPSGEQSSTKAPTSKKANATPSDTALSQESTAPAMTTGAGNAAGTTTTAQDTTDIVSQPDTPTQTAQSMVDQPETATSRISRLRAKLANSANPFGKALFAILAKDHLSETDWEDVEDTLLLADVGTEASVQLVDELRTNSRITGTSNPSQVREELRSQLLTLVGTDTDRRLNANKEDAHRPSVIIMVGVNGTGKTTTAGKLARLFVADGKKVMLGAADTFRAAAADQLETWGAQVGVPVVRSNKDGADPASVAFEASAQAKQQNVDVLIIDTAGRLQNKANLMDELGKIRRVTEKNLPVDEVLLVLDATTGQNGMTQARVFAEAIGITGVVLSKLDGSAKGGIVVSVQKELGVPVKLVGLGEGPDDLSPFDPEGFVDGILA